MSEFGSSLRRWRATRGVSQLDLARRADVSQRHISFLETGRSRPSREMVLHLGRALDVPPREQNQLLTAAGLAPAFTEYDLADVPQILEAVDFMLTAHEPHMAVVVDRRWDVVAANGSAFGLMAALFPDGPPGPENAALNLMRLSFHPDGLRHHMDGWEATGVALRRRLERDVLEHPSDSDLASLLTEVVAYPGVGDLATHSEVATGDLLVPTTYVVGQERISLFTTIAVIGDAHDVTLSELRIETFWPVDAASAEAWRRLPFVS